jgi:hypothetical protein
MKHLAVHFRSVGRCQSSEERRPSRVIWLATLPICPTAQSKTPKFIARSRESGVERATTTNQNGYFAMLFLPIGTYDVTVSRAGFATLVMQGNTVTLIKTTTRNFTLQLSSVQQSVTVTEARQIIDVTSGQIRRDLEDAMVCRLPVAGRDFRSLVTLFPGFQRPSATDLIIC